jgi:Zn-finger nucleic acid-binding protein
MVDCPVCGERLREIERSGVMVDICPSCKGIWLDRGEIDKIVEMEGRGARVASSATRGDDHTGRDKHDDRDHDDRDHDDRGYGRTHSDEGHGWDQGSSKKQRRSSLLSDLLGGLGGD